MAIYDDLIDKQEHVIRHALGARDILDALQGEIVALILAQRADAVLPTAKADLAEAEQHLPGLREAFERARDAHDAAGKQAQRLKFARATNSLTDDEKKQIDGVLAHEGETQDARDAAKSVFYEARDKVNRLPALVAALESIADVKTPTLDELLGALERG